MTTRTSIDPSTAGAEHPHTTERRRAGGLLWVGAALVLAGLAILGYIAWQLYGTTWVAEREQRRVVAATEGVWDGSSTPSADQRALAEGVVALVRIPAFGASYAVPARRGTSDDVLARGFGVLEGSAAPGHVGNLVLSGHRITHGEPLRDLPSLEPGDEVVVETEEATYTYVLDTDGGGLTVDLDAGWVTTADPVFPVTGETVSERAGSSRLLTLVTCAELFHTDDRLVVFGHLVSTRPR